MEFLRHAETAETDVKQMTPVEKCKRRLGQASGQGVEIDPVVKISDHGRHVMRSSPVPLKSRRVEERCPLNPSRAQTSSRWCGVVVRRGGASSGVVHVT
ncbi:hypothetical protein TNCV_106061 [Trichonephila clavipes]|nr:hypothetical protein TNCV_106061 [Trichonephila clavipes]